MKIFLSYASEDRPRAEEIAIALQKQGHTVFYDRNSLSGGEDYIKVIQSWLRKADRLIFLISPHAVDPGSYTLSELRLAQQKWPNPEGRVIPVLLTQTALKDIPAYLKAVTFFEARGNLVAELATHMGTAKPKRLLIGGTIMITLLVISLFFPQIRQAVFNREKALEFRISPSDYVTRFIFSPDDISKTEEVFDPATRFPDGGNQVVQLSRISYGVVGDTAAAWNITVGVTNTMEAPINLDISPRFFSLEDDLGRDARLLYFCCTTTTDVLGAGETRQVQLIYRSRPGWEGKELAANFIYFRIEGLLPLVRGSWTIRPMATAD